LTGLDAQPRLEPDTILVDQTHASHRNVKEIRRHLSDTVEGRFRRRVEDLVAPERVQALSLVVGECGFHGINSRAITKSRSGRSLILTILANNRNFTIFRSPALSLNHPENSML
jgi:hypothetical protein